MAPPTPEVLAQAALYVILDEAASQPIPAESTPWNALSFGRLGGEAPTHEFEFDHEAIPATRGEDAAITSKSSVRVTSRLDTSASSSSAAGLTYDVTVKTTTLSDSSATEHTFTNVRASLIAEDSPKQRKNRLVSTLGDQRVSTTIVRQAPPNPRSPPTISNAERLHVFPNNTSGARTTLVRPPPGWLLSLGNDVLNAAKGKGGIRAPMPSVVVDVKVQVGEIVKKGQAIVILESMKTETVLRADKDGKVKAVSCKKGEMVQEGFELVLFEQEEEQNTD